jgi:hypothetical protein
MKGQCNYFMQKFMQSPSFRVHSFEINTFTYKISLCSVFSMFNNCSSFNLYKAKIDFPLHEIDVNN